ncbi:hypothetical protein [Streptomyces goshikiensis]|uniref:hypothetical protein n=1 Tax=Streptomyces goshikiensis TaxID=1942 RepID=UPI002E0D7169|nr:hypothetical protein OG224_06755 [Streptomyces goshikiensis]
MTTDAERLINEAFTDTPTAYRDPTPNPAIGTAQPVPQPGRPPMSQRATDASTLMLTAGLSTVPPGLIAIGLLIASDYADPVVVGMICAAPAVIAVPILAVARLLRGAQGIAPPEHHHHYNGPVSQQHHNVNTQTRGLIAKTTNNGS